MSILRICLMLVVVVLLLQVVATAVAGHSLSSDKQIANEMPVLRMNYAPDEIIVKFKRSVADRLGDGGYAADVMLSNSLDKLNKKYKFKKVEALFKNFKEHRQRIEDLKGKSEATLTKKERHILKRLKRVPRGTKVPDLDRIYKIEVELEAGQSLEDVVAGYNNNADVEYAELNYIVSVDLIPNDPEYSNQWALPKIDVPKAWDIETGSLDIVVAVVDTGVDYTHSDLDDNMWVNEVELNGEAGVDDDGNGYIDDIYGYDFINSDTNPTDDNGHGTHCAGTIAAKGNNALDIAGVCWDAKIMGLKFLGSDGSGDVSDAVSAFYYAIDKGADVISNSWGGGGYSQSTQDAINYAYSQGVIMVAAAGNGNSSFPHYPAYYDNMIAVAATDSEDKKRSSSNYGDWVDISAPGANILSLKNNGGTTYKSGTSMACPHVAGVTALLFARFPDALLDDLIARLLATADNISSQNPGYDGLLGSGRLNANKAIRAGFEGVITFDRAQYSCNDVVSIELLDFDLMELETQEVTVTTDGGDFEMVVLAKDINEPWILTGTIDTNTGSVVTGNGMLQVSHGQTIIADYYDSDYGTGTPAVVQSIAMADCEEPLIVSVYVKSVTSSGAVVALTTDEPTTASVRCGLICSDVNSVFGEDLSLRTKHSVYLGGLTSQTKYYFVVDANDGVGNKSTNDNAGGCYWFETAAQPEGLHVPTEYETIQVAIDAAVGGETILVADGVYTGEGNRDISFKGKSITVKSENGPENCIIDCQGSASENHYGFYFGSGEGPDSIIDGFTITNAYNSSHSTNGGAGIVCDRMTNNPTIQNCIITGNVALLGGGIACIKSHPLISNCIITNNTASYDAGGGIYCHDGSNATIIGCYIANNEAKYKGGGIFCNGGSPTIINSVIANNWAGSWGGGGINSWTGSSPMIRNCTFRGNSSSGSGDAICLGSNTNVTLINCILWDNGNKEIEFDPYSHNQQVLVSYSNIKGGWSGTNNMNVDPLFLDQFNNDYHLKSQAGRWDVFNEMWVQDTVTSLCIDAGGTGTYWRSELWPHGKQINMGAYGGTLQASMSLSTVGNKADFNNNGFVNVEDAGLFAEMWLGREVPSAEDIDRNGFVNFSDFAEFGGNWPWQGNWEENKAQNPNPANGALIDPNTILSLSWSAGIGAFSHNVYFGTTSPGDFHGNQTETSFNPGSLDIGTIYYWRIDEVSTGGTTSGDVWTFTTWSIEPICWWKFDEGEGDIAYDSEGSNDGTIFDVNWVSGKIGDYALDFNGVSDYVEIANDPKINFVQEDFTISMWFKLDPAVEGKLYLISKGYSPSSYMVYYKNRKINFVVETGWWNPVVSGTSVDDGLWHHVAALKTGNTLKLYLDGNQEGGRGLSGAMSENSNSLKIGANSSANGNFWKGIIDDVRIYDRALSVDEVELLYQEGLE